MRTPVIPIVVPIDGIVFKGRCYYHGATLLAGASAASTLDVHQGTNTGDPRLDRLYAGISEVERSWVEDGIECWSGIYANVDGNQTSAIVFYSLPAEDEEEA